MGFSVYRVKRVLVSTGEELGFFNLIFPAVEIPFDFTPGDYTFADLAAYPDFPLTAHILTMSKYVDMVKAFGFGNVLSVEDYPGENWVLNNGAYLSISEGRVTEDFKSVVYTVHYPDGTQMFNGRFTDAAAGFAPILPLPCVVGDDREGLMAYGSLNISKVGWKDTAVPCDISKIKPFNFFAGAEPIFTTTDPYGDGGVSGGGGGTGTFDGTGDAISIPSLPTLSAVNAGFITLFNPSLGEMNELSSYMWSDLFDIEGWKKVFADPMNAILGLSIVPVDVPASGAKEVKVGNISTGISMTVAASQYVEVDCGTIDVKEFWGAYLDYDPYTKAEIYLPYVGTHPISADDIMGKSVHVVYHVDILSGACCAYVQCGGTVLYTFVGQCSSSVPITGDNWTNVINGALSIAGSIGSMVATGGASAPMAVSQIASTAVNQMKPSVEKSGAMGGTGGMLGVQTPYLILTRPRQALPKDQNVFIGYPSFITEKLGDLTGYTEIDSIHIENIPATENELSEIESLLKGGVIL